MDQNVVIAFVSTYLHYMLESVRHELEVVRIGPVSISVFRSCHFAHSFGRLDEVDDVTHDQADGN